MIEPRYYHDLGAMNMGWLDAHYHFSFARYYDEQYMGHGPLRVINDDRIRPHTGFDMHPHQNMEIITYVRSGAITHEDNMGNIGRTEAGNVQVMSAGTGVVHSEWNKEDEDTTMYQIWIEPHTQNVQPRWEMRAFPKTRDNHFHALVSGDNEGAVSIHAHATLYGGLFEKGHTHMASLSGNGYLLVSEGVVILDGTTTLSKGDGARLSDLSEISLAIDEDAELLLIDLPVMQ